MRAAHQRPAGMASLCTEISTAAEADRLSWDLLWGTGDSSPAPDPVQGGGRSPNCPGEVLERPQCSGHGGASYLPILNRDRDILPCRGEGLRSVLGASWPGFLRSLPSPPLPSGDPPGAGKPPEELGQSERPDGEGLGSARAGRFGPPAALGAGYHAAEDGPGVQPLQHFLGEVGGSSLRPDPARLWGQRGRGGGEALGLATLVLTIKSAAAAAATLRS